MTYQKVLEYLYHKLPMYQRVGKAAFKKDLTNTVNLLEFLGNPHQKFKSVHIAGTNGKGTSAHGIAAILQSAGYRTGLYTSPHLKRFTERIRISGQEVSESFVVEFVEKVMPKIEEINPSFFEITVAMAFQYFAEMAIDIAVVETGLGGRLDSTNVIIPEVSLITNIGLDHTDILGDTLGQIAKEKAGIIKPGVPVVIGEMLPETQPVFERIATANKAKLIFAGTKSWHPKRLMPNYMIKNYSGIVETIRQLGKQGWKINDENMTYGLDHIHELTGLKGRFQILSLEPMTIADVSHNQEGLTLLFDQLQELCKGTIHLIFGTVRDKDLTPIFSVFPDHATIYWTQSSVPRALSVEKLAYLGQANGKQGTCFMQVNDAIREAKEKAQPGDIVLITGSTFVVAEIDDL